MLIRNPAPLRAIPYGAPAIENRLLRVPMTCSLYGGTDTPLVEIPPQVLFSLTLHHHTSPGQAAEWVVGTMEGSMLILSYFAGEVSFRARSSTPGANYESALRPVDDYLVMDRHYTRRLLYDMALAS